jgi:hypothetical protein
VAGENPGFIVQRHEAGTKRVHDLIGVAAGQVGAADATGEKCVAGNDQLEQGKMEAD